ncbi:class I SAM-dependent methyltransferase [Halobacillus mangrovi]|uniref:SAM-dependent methyltransferase n=1 Tax=Halobacillus mangrovi TaxID=402384 RepID=A0A1W5ZXB6_9BACI|nr:class I SAM-dependent methyltransferase [Halobacillus mangrovi]ARI77891.1 SAM-dependent methyltransferase [Halobacillus mangrovi]
MKQTNFSGIADRYDLNDYRRDEICRDNRLKTYIETHDRSSYEILDLSCGTGLYLAHQIKEFKDTDMNWHGLDASEQMLEKAKDRLGNVSFVHGAAESMPYRSESFDYIANHYAFHHYLHKQQVLDEIYRILKPGGMYFMHNIAVDHMPLWWLYYYFPSAQVEDQKRFWDKGLIYDQLNKRGFKVDLQIDYQLKEVKIAEYLHFAENRDISALTLISEDEYKEGLERMRLDVQVDPEATVVNDFAELFCVADKI